MPQYVDESAGKATITITLDVENQDTVQYSTEQQLTNGQKVTKSDIGSIIPLVVDDIDTTSSINGEVRVSVDHPSVSDLYKQSFIISGDLVLDGLVGWWPLNEQSGSTANDISGNGNDGTVNGATQGVWGRGGLTAYSFDGSDSVRLTSELYSGQTVCYLFYHRSNSTQQVTGDSDRGWHWIRHDPSNNNLELLGGGGNLQTISVQLPIYEWTHLTIDYTGSSTTVYKNSDFVTDYTGSGSGEAVSIQDIGTGGDSYFDGLVCDFRVYDGEISDDEIKTIYRWGSGDYTDQSLHDGSDTNAISRWKFNGDVTDSWGSNDATYDTSLVFSSDAIRGQALSFDGQEDYVKVSDSEELDVSKITVSLWFNSESDATDFSGSVRSIIARDDNGTERAWKIGIEDDGSSGIYRLEMFANDRNIIQTSDHPVNINSWMNVVFTYDGEKTRLYENGDQIASATNSGDVKNVDQPINIGGPAELEDNRYFKGLIDDVRIYNRALSKDEVFQLYQWGTRGQNLKEAIENYQPN